MSLNELTKEEVADLAAMLFNFQLLGPTVILELAEKYPWLVQRAPKRYEMETLLDLARRGKTIDETDDEYWRLSNELRALYTFDVQVELWEKGEPCFPLVVECALNEVYREKVALALKVPVMMLRRWETALSKPHPALQKQVVETLRQMVQEEREAQE